MRPRFSVVLPLLERVDHVGRSAVSVLAQTFGDLELVVVHPGGTDGLLDAVRLVADRRVRFHRASSLDRASPIELTAEGILAARGERVAVVDAATTARANWLARCGKLLDRTGADVVFCGGSQHHPDGSRSEIRPAPFCLRPGAVLAPPDDLIELIHCDLDTFTGEGTTGRAPNVVHTPEALLDWWEAEPLHAPHDDRLRLRWAREAIEVLGDSPIPDVDLLARYATIGGIAAARLRDHGESRALLGLARRLRPGELKPFARWAVAGIPPLAERVWDPQRDRPTASGRTPDPRGRTPADR